MIQNNDLISCECLTCKSIFKKSNASSTKTCYECKRKKHNEKAKISREKKKATLATLKKIKVCTECKCPLPRFKQSYCSSECIKKSYTRIYGN